MGDGGGWKGVEHARGVCTVCGRIIAGGVRADTGRVVIRQHGPRNDRCKGGGREAPHTWARSAAAPEQGEAT